MVNKRLELKRTTSSYYLWSDQYLCRASSTSVGVRATTPRSRPTVPTPTATQKYHERRRKCAKSPAQINLPACTACCLSVKSMTQPQNHPKAQRIQTSHGYKIPASARTRYTIPRMPCPITSPSHIKPKRPIVSRTVIHACRLKTLLRTKRRWSGPHRYRAPPQPCQTKCVMSAQESSVHTREHTDCSTHPLRNRGTNAIVNFHYNEN